MSQFSGESADLAVRVVPNAGRTGCVGLMADGLSWKIKLAAPAVDGKANAALIEYLAEAIDVSKSSLEIVRGATSRQKLLRIRGVTPALLAEKLGALSR